MYVASFIIDGFTGPDDDDLNHQAIFHLCDALIKRDIDYLRKFPNTVDIYHSGVRYYVDPDPNAVEEWKDIPTLLKTGYGNCKDFAAWRIAELLVKHGIDSDPAILFKRFEDGSQIYHVIVEHPNKMTEDPSIQLGMT